MNFIAPDCKLGRHVTIGRFVVIHPQVTLGDNVVIGDHSIIGQLPQKGRSSSLKLKVKPRPTKIGTGSRIGSGCIIYAGATIGPDCVIADLAAIREDFKLGRQSIIGRGVMIEESVTIGSYVKVMTQTHITGFTTISHHVFIGPHVVTANDNKLDREGIQVHQVNGPTIKKAARIGANATILPNITIGPDSLVAAGAVVTKNVPGYTIVMGVPARPVGKIPLEDRYASKFR
ncbi:MAG: hypothetical protein A2784_04150 [Candidatus Chisholmbacteria bacterium RIFCSPHIGHO2_01_FULL_48_12]|uniref:UDP-3-O-(3-hydroxymyristoyl)glucosamine N-acyltransferase n=1 Tax=Candidatus Chisholmbacteria bacterium RIFCSPHIGHO2_01_FULL_48_12 TaxID=1797589 RepID=A0A1G1VNN2_9BACT|nr:MAG: hypothetical protein A2784_04150 [Candidatus Chisholmbacteria bacterium RIFCSPHIGHO2_01_FULL_48_12]